MIALQVRRLTPHSRFWARDPRQYANYKIMRTLASLVEFGNVTANPVGDLVSLGPSRRAKVFGGQKRVVVTPARKRTSPWEM